MFKVTLDVKPALRMLEQLQKDTERATVMALNRVAVTVRAEASRSVSKASGMKVSEVKEKMPLVKADRSTLTATIIAKPWSPNLIRYQARQTKAGVSAKAWGQRKIYPRTFIGNKGRTVFTRVGKARLPLKALHGPSIPREFIKDANLTAMKSVVTNRFPIEFDSAVRSLTRRR